VPAPALQEGSTMMDYGELPYRQIDWGRRKGHAVPAPALQEGSTMMDYGELPYRQSQPRPDTASNAIGSAIKGG
jgi:hypothetical protein